MQQFSSVRNQPIALSASTESQVYLLFALALALTVVGMFLGLSVLPIASSPLLIVCLIAELAIIFTSRRWVNVTPLNYVLFALFPILSGFTFAPYIVSVLASYVNGASILLNAFVSTIFMALAAAVFARTTSWNLSMLGRILFFAILGLVFFSILQIFVPAFQTSQAEMLISGLGIIVFAGFTAYDLQRIKMMGRVGASPFMMALSLYLDIFNLFIFILRFMLAISGQRR